MIAAVQLGHEVREVLRRVRRPLTAAEIFERLPEERRIEGADGPGDAVSLVELELRRLERGGLVEHEVEVAARGGNGKTAITGAPTWKVPC